MRRRAFLSGALASSATLVSTAEKTEATRLGVSIASYGLRWRNRGQPQESWRNALDVLDHCAGLEAACLQIGVSGWEKDFADKVRTRREKLGLMIEGQIGLPKNDADVDRFAAQVKQASEAGATILRTVCLGGRRYETFKTLQDWKDFHANSIARIELAEPVIRRHGMVLAIENHKDWRKDEFVEILRRFDSEAIGVNFDFGNNLSLLEDPTEVAEALAPWIRTAHIKDMGVQKIDEGFLLSEVPLGDGILDLPQLVKICRRHFPQVQFNLEMITRDPLVVPTATDSYRTTMPNLADSEIARAMASLTADQADSLPSVSDKEPAARIAYEEANNVTCFANATKSGLLTM